jgi:hypothetical protein
VATISVTANPADASVSLTAGSLAGLTSISITRNDPDGISRAVRSATSVATNGAATMAFFDYECPLDQAVTYTLTPDTGSPVTSSAVEIVTDGMTYWLKDIASAPLSRTVQVADMSSVKRPARVLGRYDVLGRKNPVIVQDVRGGRQGTFWLNTADAAEASGVRALLDTGFVLFLQCPASVGFPDMYFTAADVDESFLRAMGPERLWEVPFTEVDAPTDDLVAVGSNSWLTVTQFGTWNNLKNKRLTWLDVLNLPYTSGDAP